MGPLSPARFSCLALVFATSPKPVFGRKTKLLWGCFITTSPRQAMTSPNPGYCRRLWACTGRLPRFVRQLPEGLVCITHGREQLTTCCNARCHSLVHPCNTHRSTPATHNSQVAADLPDDAWLLISDTLQTARLSHVNRLPGFETKRVSLFSRMPLPPLRRGPPPLQKRGIRTDHQGSFWTQGSLGKVDLPSWLFAFNSVHSVPEIEVGPRLEISRRSRKSCWGSICSVRRSESVVWAVPLCG